MKWRTDLKHSLKQSLQMVALAESWKRLKVA
jgi:hypothetical protein